MPRRTPPGCTWRLLFSERPRRGERGQERELRSADWEGEDMTCHAPGVQRVEVRSVVERVQIGEWFDAERTDGVVVMRIGRFELVAVERKDGTAKVRFRR